MNGPFYVQDNNFQDISETWYSNSYWFSFQYYLALQFSNFQLYFFIHTISIDWERKLINFTSFS